MLGAANIHIQPVATNFFINIYIGKQAQKLCLLHSTALKIKEFFLSAYVAFVSWKSVLEVTNPGFSSSQTVWFSWSELKDSTSLLAAKPSSHGPLPVVAK